MNIVGIIAEYNPMHNGHIYHIKRAKELSNADYCVVIMSGSFTEQGNIAVLDKFTRAKIAIQNGADLVIELPTIYSTSSAEGFAYGAVNILNSLGCITHLAFGAETNDIFALEEIAKTCIEKKEQIISSTKEYLKQGVTSATARDSALKAILKAEHYSMINKPNNILGIEYLKALFALKSKIQPVLIERHNSNHNELKIVQNNQYVSSTAIRLTLSKPEHLLNENLRIIASFVPENTINELEKNTFKTDEYLWRILRYEIIKLGKDGIRNIAEVTEGLENKLYDSIPHSNSYHEYLLNIKSKRYTLSRLKRICSYIILGITKDLKKQLQNVDYCRILKIDKKSTELLSIISKNASNKVITKITNDVNDEQIASSLKLDILANDISHITAKDYTNNIIC